MNGYIGTPPFLRNALSVAMETMHFYIVWTGSFLSNSFSHLGGPMDNLAPLRNLPGCAT